MSNSLKTAKIKYIHLTRLELMIKGSLLHTKGTDYNIFKLKCTTGNYNYTNSSLLH